MRELRYLAASIAPSTPTKRRLSLPAPCIGRRGALGRIVETRDLLVILTKDDRGRFGKALADIGDVLRGEGCDVHGDIVIIKRSLRGMSINELRGLLQSKLLPRKRPHGTGGNLPFVGFQLDAGTANLTTEPLRLQP